MTSEFDSEPKSPVFFQLPYSNMSNTALTKTAPPPLVQPPAKVSAYDILASRCNVERKALHTTLKNTVFRNATDDELMALVVVANTYGFNPFTKELYAFPAKNGGIVPVVSIDGWVTLCNRQEDYDGIEFSYAWKDGEETKPHSCTCRIFHKRRSKHIEVTEYFDECYRSTDPWNKMPRRMLRHKALIQAARVAFGFSGIYDEDEARDFADERRMKNVTPVASAPDFEQPGAPKSLPAPTKAPAQDAAQEDEIPMESTPEPAPESAATESAPSENPYQIDVPPDIQGQALFDLVKATIDRFNIKPVQLTNYLRSTGMARKDQQWNNIASSKLIALLQSWAERVDEIRTVDA